MERLGRYELIARLAAGGMGEVFLARLEGAAGFAKLFAVKRILPQFAANAQFTKMFLHEARLVARLDHPNIAQVYDIGQTGESYFFTMEYVHGEDLRRLLNHAYRVGRGLPLEHAVAVGIGIAAGLHHAHEQVDDQGRLRRIVHRDVAGSDVAAGIRSRRSSRLDRGGRGGSVGCVLCRLRGRVRADARAAQPAANRGSIADRVTVRAPYEHRVRFS